MRVISCLMVAAVVFGVSTSLEMPRLFAAPGTKKSSTQTLKRIQERTQSEGNRQRLRDQMFWVRRRAARKFQQNEEWYKEAVEKERNAVIKAEEALADGNYEKTRDRYLKALEIQYTQWHFVAALTRIINNTPNWHEDETIELVFEKKYHRLSTPYTTLALSRMESIDELIAEDELMEKTRSADTAYEAEKFARAYSLFREALDIARRTEESALAAAYAGEIKKKRDAIYNGGLRLLQDGEAALAAANGEDLLPALAEMQEKYSAFKGFGPLAARCRRLVASPIVKQLRREQAAERKLDIADGALLRKDYLHAERYYQDLVKRYPGTKAATIGGQRLEDMGDNPEVARIISEQEAELACTGLMARAREWIRLGQVEQAVAEYDKIIAEYPGTVWAEKAALARKVPSASKTNSSDVVDGKAEAE